MRSNDKFKFPQGRIKYYVILRYVMLTNSPSNSSFSILQQGSRRCADGTERKLNEIKAGKSDVQTSQSDVQTSWVVTGSSQPCSAQPWKRLLSNIRCWVFAIIFVWFLAGSRNCGGRSISIAFQWWHHTYCSLFKPHRAKRGSGKIKHKNEEFVTRI